MDRIMGTVITALGESAKRVASIEVKVKVTSNSQFKVADIQLQEGKRATEFGCAAPGHFETDNEEAHYNFLARGVATLVIPYMSDIPHTTGGQMLPCETEYITTPIKADILIHKPFKKSQEEFSIGAGLTGTSKCCTLNVDVDKFTHCVYDGYISKQYLDGKEKANVFLGRELRLPNADAKYTLHQDAKRKTTGLLCAKKTRRVES